MTIVDIERPGGPSHSRVVATIHRETACDETLIHADGHSKRRSGKHPRALVAANRSPDLRAWKVTLTGPVPLFVLKAIAVRVAQAPRSGNAWSRVSRMRERRATHQPRRSTAVASALFQR